MHACKRSPHLTETHPSNPPPANRVGSAQTFQRFSQRTPASGSRDVHHHLIREVNRPAPHRGPRTNHAGTIPPLPTRPDLYTPDVGEHIKFVGASHTIIKVWCVIGLNAIAKNNVKST